MLWRLIDLLAPSGERVRSAEPLGRLTKLPCFVSVAHFSPAVLLQPTTPLVADSSNSPPWPASNAPAHQRGGVAHTAAPLYNMDTDRALGIYIKGVSEETTEVDLQSTFSQFGAITETVIKGERGWALVHRAAGALWGNAPLAKAVESKPARGQHAATVSQRRARPRDWRHAMQRRGSAAR